MINDNMNDIPEISIIIPLYNVSKVCRRCLKSIEMQTYENYEVIFVDDGSTDNSDKLISRWITDTGINAVLYRHPMNQGVSKSRNDGLKLSRGKYIYYVDADDYIERDTLKILYNGTDNGKYDIVGCEWWLSYSDSERHIKHPDVTDNLDGFKKICKGSLRCNLWTYMAKKKLYEDNDLEYLSSMNMGEDISMMARLMLSAKSVNIIHSPLYHYNQSNSESISNHYIVHRESLERNIGQVEDFIIGKKFKDLLNYIDVMKLTVKLPLLISTDIKDYEMWNAWFPGAMASLNLNDEIPFYTRFIQKMAYKRKYAILKLYNILHRKIISLVFP